MLGRLRSWVTVQYIPRAGRHHRMYSYSVPEHASTYCELQLGAQARLHWRGKSGRPTGQLLEVSRPRSVFPHGARDAASSAAY